MDSRPCKGRSPRGFKTPSLDREELPPLVSSFVAFESCITLCVHGSSTCVIVLIDLSVSPRVFPRVLRVLRRIPSIL